MIYAFLSSFKTPAGRPFLNARSIFSEEHLYASNRSAKIPVLGGLRLQDALTHLGRP